MEPRLKTSTKWTPFPSELNENAALVLMERFSEDYDLDGSHFVVDGRIYSQEIVGRFGLYSKNSLKQQNFEISFEYDSSKEKALDLIHQSMDVVEHLWQELFEDDLDDSELLKTWQTLPYEKKMYFFRYSTLNTKLEEEADKLLSQFDKKLVHIDDEESDHEIDLDDNLEDYDSDEDQDDEDTFDKSSTFKKSDKKTIH
jgi:hypothetical protein